MKYMRSHACRWLARALALVMTALQMLWAPPAQAQRGPITVYVLDFNNRTTVGGALLGRTAAAQMALQMADSPNWDVVPDAQVQRRIAELGLKPPFDRINRAQIAAGVDARAVVYGSVVEARVVTQPQPQAFARIQVQIEDIRTGELVNGAIAEGASVPRMGFTGDADLLLEEAIGKAAFRAREFIDRFRLPEGTVLNTTVVGTPDQPELDVMINFGARQGARRGMILIATRVGDPVGRVKLLNVDSDVSTGRVIENQQGVRPEDRVRAIFNFADFPISRSRLRGAVDAPVKLAAAIGDENPATPPQPGDDKQPRIARAGSKSEFVPAGGALDRGTQIAQATVQPPPPVVVDEPEPEQTGGNGGRHKFMSGGAFKLLVGGLLVLGILAVGGRGGGAAHRAFDTEAYAWQLTPADPAGTRIKVTWSRPKGINSEQVVQYVIYRASSVDPNPQIVGVAYTDARKEFIDNTAARNLANVYTSVPGDPAPAIGTITAAPGISEGQTHRYQIATAWRGGIDPDGSGTGGGGQGGGQGGGGTGGSGGSTIIRLSELSDTSPWATAIAQPPISNPSQDAQVQLDQLSITWQQVRGADTYYIWLARDPGFRNNRTQFGPFRTVPFEQGGPQSVTQVFDASRFKAQKDRPVYISVGAKSSADRIAPRPFGAIFGPAVSVTAEIVPPPPPSAQLKPGKGKTGSQTLEKPGKSKGRNGTYKD